MLQTTIKTALFGTVEGYALDDGHVIYIIKEDNDGLGRFRDNIQHLSKAIAYLQLSSGEHKE
jgi:hypothetical protein